MHFKRGKSEWITGCDVGDVVYWEPHEKKEDLVLEKVRGRDELCVCVCLSVFMLQTHCPYSI